MHRLVRIEGLHDFKYYNHLKFVLYDGSKYIILNAKIQENYIMFDDFERSANILFKGFGIKDRWEYCKKYDARCSDGIFPVFSSLSLLKKTLLSFFDLNTDIEIPPMYKVGDKVRIKSEYDLGSDMADYPCGFAEKMLAIGSDKKTYTISSIQYSTKTALNYERKHYKEPYYYKLEENIYNWSAAMFEGEVAKYESSTKESAKISSIEGVMVHLTNGEKIRLYRATNYYSGVLKVLENLRIIKKGSPYGSIFHSKIMCSKRDCCYEPEVIDGSLLWVILDYLKYYFGTEECKKTINPEFYKYLKEKPKQGIVEQIEYSQTKTQGNAYQFCKRRGTVCRGDVPEGRTVQGKRSKASVSSRSLAYRAVIGQ